MKVYGLAGKSGTGKSYQSMTLCREKKIDSIIDDGLFIYQNTVQAGKSAKREDTKIGAVKAALFHDEFRRREVAYKIKEINPKSILILGTSVGMIEKIAQRLELPEVEEIVLIEDISSEDDIATALRQRKEMGKHVIPAPTFELKPQFSGYFLAPLRMFKERGIRGSFSEKTVVRPTYSYIGNFSISDRAVAEIAAYAGEKNPDVAAVTKVAVNKGGEGIEIHAVVIINYGCNIVNTAQIMQEQISDSVNRMTAFNVLAVNVEVKGLRRKSRAL